MANEVLQKTGTPQIQFADHATDFTSPTAANDLTVGTPTESQLDLTSLGNGSARQSAKVDLGATRAAAYAIKAAIEIAATPTAGNVIELYWAASGNGTAANANPGGVSGSDAAYAGYSSNLAASVKQLERIGTFVCTAQATGTVQIADCGVFSPSERYGCLIVKNESGVALHSDAAEMNIVFNPITDEIQ